MMKNEIHFLPKYPAIEKLVFNENYLKRFCKLANEYPIYWNNYFLWDKSKGEPTIVMHDIVKYNETINIAIFESFLNTNYFISTFVNANQHSISNE